MSPQEELKHRRFVSLFTAHQSAIHAYVRRLTPRRVDACDVMQEVALVLWKKFDQFDVDGDFRGWAFGVARFQALAWRRDVARERKRLVLSPDTLELMSEETAAHADQLDLERQAIFQHCLGKLKPDQRSAVEAMYIGLAGPRVTNTCGQMGIATGYAAVVCKKHIRELRTLIGFESA